RIPSAAAREEIRRVLDMRTSFKMEITLCFRCRWRRNSGAGTRSSCGFAPAGGLYNLTIHRLLARELNLAQQPPDCRMEPQHGADQFFAQGKDPIPTADVEQL